MISLYDFGVLWRYRARCEALLSSGPISRRSATPEILSPKPGDWLQWRATVDSWGCFDLAEIIADNVGELDYIWGWAMEPGDQETAPIVHDGVMHVANPGGIVQAGGRFAGLRRLPYDRPELMASLMRLGELDASIVWEPHLARPTLEPLDFFAARASVAPLRENIRSVAILLRTQDEMLRTMIDNAIGVLAED